MAEIELAKRADGSIVTQPVLRYTVLGLQGLGLLQVIFAASREDFEAKRSSLVQLAVSAELARGMAKALAEVADALDPPPAELALPDDLGFASGEIVGDPLVPPSADGMDTDYRLLEEPFDLRFDGDMPTGEPDTPDR